MYSKSNGMPVLCMWSDRRQTYKWLLIANQMDTNVVVFVLCFNVLLLFSLAKQNAYIKNWLLVFIDGDVPFLQVFNQIICNFWLDLNRLSI